MYTIKLLREPDKLHPITFFFQLTCASRLGQSNGAFCRSTTLGVVAYDCRLQKNSTKRLVIPLLGDRLDLHRGCSSKPCRPGGSHSQSDRNGIDSRGPDQANTARRRMKQRTSLWLSSHGIWATRIRDGIRGFYPVMRPRSGSCGENGK
ncbi:hypothetical protein VTO42DRAFT_1481 [Malbranchea cinnamomea]